VKEKTELEGKIPNYQTCDCLQEMPPWLCHSWYNKKKIILEDSSKRWCINKNQSSIPPLSNQTWRGFSEDRLISLIMVLAMNNDI